MRFSIIIPVYNVAEYIKKCLDSIVNQDFTDYEIVVVDDETPDNSMQIVEGYVKSYPERFQIIHQKNKGQGGARNTGAAAARGEYLIFVDSDDYIVEGMLKAVDALLSQTPCDIVMFNSQEVLPTGKVLSRQTWFPESRICETEEEKAKLLLATPAPWNKVYRREFYMESGFQFPEKMIYEDVATRLLTAKAGRIVLCKEHFYCYVQRQGSTMNSKVSPRVLDIIKVTDLVYDRFAAEEFAECYKLPMEAALTHSVFHVAENVYQRAKHDPLLKQIIDYLVERFPNYMDNPLLANQVKKEIRYLSSGQYLRYEQAKRLREIKGTLYRNPAIRWLNSLRKRRK